MDDIEEQLKQSEELNMILSKKLRYTLSALQIMANKNDFILELLLQNMFLSKEFNKDKVRVKTKGDINAVLKIYNDKFAELEDEIEKVDSKLGEYWNDRT